MRQQWVWNELSGADIRTVMTPNSLVPFDPSHCPDHCLRHGGVEPFPSPTCPDCAGAGSGSARPGASPGLPTGAGEPPGLALDPDALRGLATTAAGNAEDLRTVLASAGPSLADVPGDLRTITVLRSCAEHRLAAATVLSDRIGAVAAKLTDTVTGYAALEDDLAARLTALAGQE